MTFEWSCPHPGCGYHVLRYGETSLNIAREYHLDEHMKAARRGLDYPKEPVFSEHDRQLLRRFGISV